METPNVNKVYLPDIVGKGYATYWNFKGRYAVVKGSRGSKKSKTTALWVIYNMMKYPEANTLIVRKTERTLKDSCFSDLKWAINRLGVDNFWKSTINPLEITYIPTGQKILFRGFDDPLKITSISVEKGVLCWCWIEEAYEIFNESDFDMLNESIRGAMPEGLFKRFMITFNPWSDKHWLKRRFFDVPDSEDKIALTTTYRCNEWLDEADKRLLEDMQFTNPRRWAVAANGEWGVVDGLVFENWCEEDFDWRQIARQEGVKSMFGLDFGYTNDPTAFVCGLIDTSTKDIWVFDEIYKKGMSNEQIYEEILHAGYSKEKIVADSSEPKSIDRLYDLGLRRIKRARKGKDSIMNGIDFLQDYRIHIHPKCNNFVTEISNYVWDEDKAGNKINRPIDNFNHCLVAGTMITTKRGRVPIEEVTTDDEVLTRNGYRKVLFSGVTDVNRGVYKVTSDKGNYIIGTGNHKVLTSKGFCDIDSLRYGDKLLLRNEKCQNQLLHTEENGRDTLTPKGGVIESIIKAVVNTYTTLFGKNTSENVEKDMSSIIKTEIVKTTTSKTSKKSLKKNTQNDILAQKKTRKEQEKNSKKWISLENGTLVKKVKSGIVNTLKSLISVISSLVKKCVRFVVNILSQKNQTKNSVQIIVKVNTEELMDLMMLLNVANTAEKNLKQINIQNPDFVVGRVQTVEFVGNADKVYDLTIEDTPEFFANGILVHNCLDALRYSCEEFARGSLIGFD